MALGGTNTRRVFRHLFAAALLLGAFSGPAAAHSVVVESSPKDKEVLPRAPAEVMIRFSAKIERSLTRASLSTGNGQIISLPAVTEKAGGDRPDRLVIPLPSLGPGDYLLRFKVLSTDGHATSGVLHFRVVGGP